jgi:hypothetical protein
MRWNNLLVDPPDGQIQSNIRNPVKPEFIDTLARWQIPQYPGDLVFEYEGSHLFRIVPLDGRPHAGSSIVANSIVDGTK